MRPSTTLRLAAASVSAVLLPAVGVTSASALDGPGPIGPGSVHLSTFAGGLTGWTAVTGSIDEWSSEGGTIAVDTLAQSAGRYIRPADALTLPDAYELRTHVRVDEIGPQGTVTVMLDLRDTVNWKSTGISPQLTSFDDDRAGFRISKPITGAFVCEGGSPVAPGEWVELVIRRAAGITAVYADGALLAAVASPTAGGTFGFGAYRSRVAFGPVSIDPLESVPAGHPTDPAGCPWVPPAEPGVEPDPAPGDGEVSGDGEWIPATATTGDRPGHEITAGRSRISLDGDWAFRAEDLARASDPDAPDVDGVAEGWHEPATDVSDWDTLSVPGNWSVHDRYGRYEGNGWYRRTFEPGSLSAAAGERASIRFGAVYDTATVWLNGARLGAHTGGYTPFEFDVTDYLVDGENTLVVRADNSFQQGAWWSWGGMSRSVELVKTGQVVIDRQQIVATPDLAAGTAHVASTVFLQNAGDEARSVSLRGRITDAATGSTVADGLHAEVEVPAGGSAQAVLAADLAPGAFQLWSMDDPNLYRLDVSLDSPVDVDDAAQSDRFGIRTFEIDGTTMRLNGEVLKLAGANRVSDDPANGNVEPTWLVRRDLDRMKASGLNLARIMHYAQAPELLDYADEIGMLLIDEVPVWGGARDLVHDIPQIQQEFREMVERDFNHASVFAHSVANEIESRSWEGREFLRIMADYSHEIDPGRFVTHANNKAEFVSAPAQDGTQFMDFVSINLYGNFAGATDKVHALYPDKPMFISEYSPDSFSFPTRREWLDFSTGADTTAQTFESRPFVFGWSQWTFNDYRSEFSGSSENLVRGWGNVDVWGRLKAAYDETQSANAPVRAFALGDVAVAAGGGLGVVSITPSGAVPADGPGNILRGYRVTLQAFDDTGAVVGGTLVDLPDLEPGAPAFEVPVAWDAQDAATRVRATLLSPTGYEVAVSVADAAAPAAPEIREVVAASTGLRVRFDDTAGIGRYRVVATAPDGTATTVTTRETFADLAGLATGVEYAVTVSAVGSDGRPGPADDVTATTAGTLALPPKAIHAEPVDGGLVLGYSSQTRNGSFEVRVTDAESGAESATHRTANRPSTRIDGLEPGAAVDVRIREVDAAGEPVSEWSEGLRVTPLGAGSDAPPLQVRGLVGGIHDAAIVLRPSNRTERYLVTVTGESVDADFAVERSGIDLIPIAGLAPDREYAVTVAAQGEAGTSPIWSGTVRTSAERPGGEASVPANVRVGNRTDDAFLAWDDSGADGYIVSRNACGSTASTTVIGAEHALGRIGERPGSYTVAAILGSSVSAPSEPVTVPGEPRCPIVVTIGEKAPRADGSVPFRTTGTWSASSLTAPGGYASVYAELAGSAGATATWTGPALEQPTRQLVEVALPSNSISTTNATYTVTTADGPTEVAIDQVERGGGWVALGEFEFDADHRPTVALKGVGGFLRASAVRFTDVGNDLPSAPSPAFAAQTIGTADAITGRGTAEGNTVVVRAADGTELGRATVAADLTWAARGDAPLAAGSYVDVVATETDADGWTGTATATLTVATVAVDGAIAAPGQAVLSSDDGWDTGLRDGSFRIGMDLWWGENATTFRLYENGELVATVPLTWGTPAAQSASVEIHGLRNGVYQYTGELENSKGVTRVEPLTVQVTDASPGRPVLSSDNWDGDGDYLVTADLWWGTNATAYRLYEDDVLVADGALAAASPGAQRASIPLADRAPGDHRYVVEFRNASGSTASEPFVVSVRRH
ncbi:glycoside hydrolase family 2 TIM barrel-domain containing protein [Agromyces sp. LHK192]|uniref:glycoside hydrolase family 2 TIM barrel-domain containing protein n=1 Tax=Agromyces sp. LHK192 TaxID=2498704 RepID=UPI0013E39C55|nr:glycoside hydrolase family 2 TIM barrel-domain containing protein [Agromyces sp. LHK192]